MRLRKCGFWVIIFLISNEMLKLSTWSVQAGTVADISGTPPLSTTSHWGCWPQFPPKRPSRAAARRGSIYVPCMMVLHPVFCCSSTIHEQRVSATLVRTRWTNSIACAFPWFILVLFYLKTSYVCCLCYSNTDIQKVKQWSRVDLRWLVWHLEFSNESDNHCSKVQHPALTLKVDTEHFL
jgi:hypothetical protein